MPDDTGHVNRMERLAARAGTVIAFERFWPPVLLGAVVLAIFVAGSWLGLWLYLPAWGRILGVAGFAAALSGAAILALRIKRPSRADALARLDRDSGQRHRPVSASQDQLANPDADPATRALWDLHRRRLAEAAKGIRVAPPSPRVVERDRFALRAVALLAVVAAAFVAGVDKEGRLAAAFDWRGAGSPAAAFRLDAWIDPPPYTGRAPVLLSGSGVSVPLNGAQQISAPVNSIVVVRSSGGGTLEVAAEGALKPPTQAAPAPGAGKAVVEASGTEKRLVLSGDGLLKITHDGGRLATYDLRAIPDLPPTVTVTGTPKGNLRGTLTLTYKIEDDYGVIGAEARFASPVLHGKPVTGRSLADAPQLPLALPSGARGLGPGQTTADLSEHPWAGAEVSMVLSAKDEGGNVGVSPPFTITLPARVFRQPLARALVEQRRDLVLDPDHHAAVAAALDALAVAPDLFDTTPPIFLGLTAAKKRLDAAKGDADLLGVADLLWSMALSIEDGTLGQTERDLRALQRELRDAVARHAPPEEIKRLTDALREQLQKFLAEMAQKNADSPPQGSADRNAKMVTEKDLQALLDKMEQSARNGDMAEAEQLLEQLQNILEHLRSAQRGDSQQQGAQQMNKSMSALDRMMRDQQSLRDKTFKRSNQQRRSAPNPDDEDSQGQPGAEPGAEPGDQPSQGDDKAPEADDGQQNGDLEAQQQDLRQQLEALQKQMRELGLQGEKGFDEAQQAMKDAEAALGQGSPGNDRAVEAQGRALQGLQKGARGLQGQMAQGEGDQQGENGTGQQDGIGRDGTDPLGREPDHNKGLNAEGGLNQSQGLAERAQQVLEELRRRLGDRLRPQEEQDYLERLLKRY